MQLLVIVNKLNKRSSVPSDFTERNIVAVVLKGTRITAQEVKNVPNPALGKWYCDADGYCYWGGGLLIESPDDPPPVKSYASVPGLPVNLPEVDFGVDISHHNGTPDWSAILNAGASFVYIKLSEGTGYTDTKANVNAQNAQKNGLQFGFYHFCKPGVRTGMTVANSAIDEAEYALQVLASMSAQPNLPMALDLENEADWDSTLSKADYYTWVKSFLLHITDNTGVEPIIYSRKEYLDRKLPDEHNLGHYKLWISLYGHSNAGTVQCPVGWNNWYMWQFSGSGALGSSSPIDLNVRQI